MQLALLSSLLAHACLLVPVYHLPARPLAQAAVPVVARLVERPPAPAAAPTGRGAASGPAASSGRAAPQPWPTAGVVAAPRPPAPREPAASSAVVSGAEKISPSRPSASGSLSDSGVAAGEVPATDSRLGGGTPATAVSADDLRQYRIDLAIASRRFKGYPVLARERGWEGRVEVAISVSAWQPRPQFSLARSSGHAPLDQQAVAMLEQAAAATLLPAGLRGRDFRILLPVEFTLDDAR